MSSILVKKGHPEPEGAVGVAPDIVYLVETKEDVEALPDTLNDYPLIVTNQTTMSQWDVSHLMDDLQERFPHVEQHKEICQATQVRQEAVADQAGAADLLIVVGDPKVIIQIVSRKCQKILHIQILTVLQTYHSLICVG